MTTTEFAARATVPEDTVPAHENALRALYTAHHNGIALAIGETTEVAGLLLTPHTHGHPLRYTGLWCLTHASSGLKVTVPAGLAHTREAITWLARKGLNWDRPGELCRADGAIEAAWGELTHLLWAAREDGHPLLYARTSWVLWPPLWRIRHRSFYSPGGYATWDAAAGLAEYAHTLPEDEFHLHPNSEIIRDLDSPGWALRCASIACSDRNWLINWFDDQCHALGSKADLRELAREEGWRWHPGDHWTCPECTRTY